MRRTVQKISSFVMSFDSIPGWDDSNVEDPKEWSLEKFSLSNIQWQLPQLKPGQDEDVLKAEIRLFKENHKGWLCTNGTGVGKAQPLNSKILTPNGWTLMGNIKEGDMVIAANGKQTRVNGVYPQGAKNIYEVSFSDGTKVRCCKEHLWETQTLQGRRNQSKLESRPLSSKKANKDLNRWKSKVRSLEEIIETLDEQHFIPIVSAIEFREKEVNIPFYTMGFLLGDGHMNTLISISTADLDAIERIESELPEGLSISHMSNYDYKICSGVSHDKKGCFIKHPWKVEFERLNLLGKKSNNKFIPDDYIFGSINQRVALLQGLMDSDGTLKADGNNPMFSSTSVILANQVAELVRSLGGTAKIKNKQTSFTYLGKKKEGLPSFVVYINLPKEIDPFYIERKKSKYKPNEKYFPRKKIISIQFVEKYLAQCISVEDERHLYVTDGYTLTHNTFVGLGIARRFIAMDLKHIIIICPTDKKCKDWIEEGEIMGITIYQLNDIHDSHHGVCVTTYANFYQNEEISKIHWHLVMYDESHYLQQNGKGETTVYEKMHKQIARLPSVRIREIDEHPEWRDSKSIEYLDHLVKKYAESTKVVFLSATPFAYVKSLKLADGCLWDINERLTYKDYNVNPHIGGYGIPGKWDEFLIENFGYRMMYGKLTIPETGVDLNLMERNFHEKYKKIGAISGRQIEVDYDYSRDFILLNSDIGKKIDDGLEIFHSDHFQKNYLVLKEWIDKRYDGLYVKQLLEAIKSRLIIPRVKEHLAYGRKVVIFHDFNMSQPVHPFKFEVDDFISTDNEDYWKVFTGLNQDIKRYQEEYIEYYNMDLSELHNPIDSILENFDEDQVCIYNGRVSKGKRSKLYREFMSDNSRMNIFLGQRKACKEGVSLHDKTGVHQRVFIDLGLPTAPTDAIQGEGRIYRVGLKSDAMYEYETIQTFFEQNAFAETISKRARTAENLALGESARNMEIIFKEGYINSAELYPSEMTGTGGKSNDHSFNEITEFEKAKTYYWANIKKNSKTKSREGNDYYATPEPLGYKMVEWLKVKSDERCLEPSSGHGAIARFFPPLSRNVFVEPSYSLASKLRINATGDVYEIDFESYAIINKFDKIAMNPPFGFSGKIAEEHLRKAIFSHLKTNEVSRLIAIVPNGPSMEKRLKEIYQEKDFKKHYTLRAEIELPMCTFERAGTKVMCKIIIIDSVPFFYTRNGPVPDNSNNFCARLDLTNCDTIEEFFNEIEDLKI